MNRAPAAVQLRYSVRSVPEAWVLTEEKVAESVPHDNEAQHLKQVLEAWAKRSGRNARVARNLAIRWLETDPRIGIDPDVCVLEPAPEDFDELSNLRSWKPEYPPPRLCFEIVSKNHPHIDYASIQDRYAAIGTEELFVFDPFLAGPLALGGPVALQHWRRDGALFERIAFGSGPAFSTVLGGWVIAKGPHLQLASDPLGSQPWLTAEEVANAEAESARIEMERANAAAQRALIEMERERSKRQELEAQLAALRDGSR